MLSGRPPGEHGIVGIGVGFVPDLVDLKAIDLVIRVSTDEARAETTRLHHQHGYCVGVSSGANMVAAARLLARSARVATLWPDCSDRYASVGLGPPVADGSGCALGPLCAARSRGMLRRRRSA